MGKYEYKTLPMGVKGAPSWFQQNLATSVLYDLVHRVLELYLVDLVLWGNTEEEYIAHLREVLERIKKYNITPITQINVVFYKKKFDT